MQVRKQLGLDRCAKMLCGSAPIAANVKDFLRVAIGAAFIEGCAHHTTPPLRAIEALDAVMRTHARRHGLDLGHADGLACSLHVVGMLIAR